MSLSMHRRERERDSNIKAHHKSTFIYSIDIDKKVISGLDENL